LKYQTPAFRYMMLDSSYGSKSPLYLALHKPSPYKSALAERLARQKAQAAAAARPDSTGRAATPGDSSRKRSSVPSGTPAGTGDSAKKPAPHPKKDTTIQPDTPPAGADGTHKDSTR